ncbi:30S ribosomal protein S1 [Clostridium sp.]|jgi:small subunit ribosomal protein S1|uniref:30S ribosomal protein S1 n=1 Tax=Clostridium sp. TaxID=1506 RepID=UPI002FDDB8B5
MTNNDQTNSVDEIVSETGMESVWSKLENKFNNGEVLEVVVKEVVKGGIIAYLYGLRAFIPASHISIRYTEDLKEFIGKTLKVKLIQLDRIKNKVVLSGKEVEKLELEEKSKELWNTLSKGDKVEGRVSRITNFGVFIDLGGVEGLAHISELSWKKVKNPSEVVSVGDKLNVYVLNLDRDRNRISLSVKRVLNSPWENIGERYKVNDIVEGVVSKVIGIGAFVEIEPGLEGLVHISQISQEHVTAPEEILKVGDKVKVKILNVDEKASRISLSIKEAEDKFSSNFKEYLDEDSDKITLGDLFKDKLKDIKFN